MPRRVLLFALAISLIASPALARPTDAEEAQALLATLATGAKDQREAASARLIELGPHVIAPLEEFLNRTRASKLADRRAVLQKIKASIPDKSGRFTSPGREEAKQIRADDEFDWFVPLFGLDPAIPGVGDVIADVVAIRALARTNDIDAARAILAVAFADESMIYRDDCGRQLRKMAPYSIPALIVGSQNKKIKTQPKYANYQLERLDRQDPHKALAAGEGNEALQIAILQAFGSTRHREAVPAVFTMINDDAPRVRAAAREAWLAYVTGPPPPPAPKKKLVMTGGRTADEETPLWFTSRELAFVELQHRAEELFNGEIIPEKADVEVVSKRIFDYYDAERARVDGEFYTSGKTKADAGDLPGAIAIYDRLLAEDPGRKERTEMAPAYFQQAETLAEQEKWADAAAMYSKAHGLDPDGAHATDALAAHYYALGKAAEAEGKDGAASFRKAVELRPDYADAKQAVQAATPGATKKKRWMLYAAAGVALGALIVLAFGLRRRRA